MYPQDYPHTPSDYRQTDKTGELGQTPYKVQYLPRFEIDNVKIKIALSKDEVRILINILVGDLV